MAEIAEGWIDHGGQGWRQDGIHKVIGTNLRMSDLSAALALSQIKRLPETRHNLYIQRQRLAHGIGPRYWDRDGPFYNILHVDNPDNFVAQLGVAGVEAKRAFRTATTHPAPATSPRS